MSIYQRFLLILSLCLLGCLGSSCRHQPEINPLRESSSPTSTPTSAITETVASSYTPEPSPTATTQLTSARIPSQTFIPITKVSPTPTRLANLDLPAWVSDPNTDVLLTATGNFEDNIPELVLVNASSGEKIVLPQFDMVGYFWTEDGRQIGLLQSDGKHVILINTLDGQVSTLEMNERASRFAFIPSAGDFPVALFAFGSDTGSSDFFFLLDYEAKSVSFDRQYFLKNDQIDEAGRGFSVLNLETEETILFSYPEDGLYEHAAAFSPNQPYLAVAQSDGLPFGFEFLRNTHASLKIYDLSRNGELISVYENVTFPEWSPDGTKFLYQPLEDMGESYGASLFWYSAPCVFERLTGKTRCYNEVMTRHQPQHGQLSITSLEWLAQTTISYIYHRTDSDLDFDHEQREVGGLCFLETEDGSERCILEELEEPEQNILRYRFSPSGNFVSFDYDTTCPVCDELSHPQLAVADPKTGKYVVVGDWHGHSLGLWRPTLKP